jgi:iron complex outermembrane receptor protein
MLTTVRGYRAVLLGSAMLGALGVSAPALAQTANAPTANAEAPVTSLEAIIVTATKRAQRLQDVPVAVTAVSGKSLEASNFREASDIQYLAPNVTFSSTNPVANGGGYQIRGVGTQTYDSGVEQTVGLVVDGVIIGLPRDPGAAGFADIERVEVLRGPQGTLFGKNASAGVIQIVTKNPRLEQTSGELNLSYGERDEQIARGVVNLPLGKTAAVRISGFYNAQDGAIPYAVRTSGHVGDRENSGVRAKLLWEPVEDLTVVLAADYQKAFARDAPIIHTLGINPRYNNLFAAFAQKPGPDTYVSFQDGDWTADTKVRGVSGQVDYRIGGFTLTSITAYRKSQMTQLSDIDHAPIDIFNYSDGALDSDQFTQELRITSPSGEKLEYVAGLYYLDTQVDGWTTQKGDFLKFSTGSALYPPAVLYGARYQLSKTKSYAAYGQATYAVTDAFKLIGGLRYTDDTVSGDLTVKAVPGYFTYGTLLPYSGEVSADNLSGRVGGQYQPSRDLMVYATYATGYKGPAIDSLNGQVKPVKPETVDSYELGVKSTLWDGRATLNLAIYRSDFTDFQAQALDLTSATPRLGLTNAGLMRAQGVEVETSILLAPGLTIGGSVSYNDAKFKDYTGACYTNQPVSTTTGQGCYLLPGSTGTYVANYDGVSLTNSPKWSYILNAAYERSVSAELKFDANVNWSWRDDTYAITADPKSIIKAYGLLNANVGIGKENGGWRVGLYARNLLDKRFYAPYPSLNLINAGGYEKLVSPDAFRTVGAKLSLSF